MDMEEYILSLPTHYNMPRPVELHPILDPYRADSLTRNSSLHLLQQRTHCLKLIVCLDRFIQHQLLSNNIKADITSYSTPAFTQLLADLNVPNRVQWTDNDMNRFSDAEMVRIERAYEEGTAEWVGKWFEMVRGEMRPTSLMGKAYTERLKVWYKKGELARIYGAPKAEAVEDHRHLIQDAIEDSLSLFASVEADDLVQKKVFYLESLRDGVDQFRERKNTRSRLFADLNKEQYHCVTFGGSIPVKEDATAEDQADKYSRPVKIFWETQDGQTKGLKIDHQANMAEFVNHVLGSYSREKVLQLADRDIPALTAKATIFETTFRPEQFGIVEALKKYLLPEATEESGMFDRENHTITLHLSHMEVSLCLSFSPFSPLMSFQIYQVSRNPITRPHNPPENSLGTLLVRLPTRHSGANLSITLPAHIPYYSPTPHNTSLQYTVIPADMPYTISPLLSGTAVFLAYNITFHPTTALPPTVSISSFPLFPIVISLLTARKLLPKGGLVGMHLRYSYGHTGQDIEDGDHLASLLRGSDLALYTILASLGLDPFLTAVVENDHGDHPAPKCSDEHVFVGLEESKDNVYNYNALTGRLQKVPFDITIANTNTYKPDMEPKEHRFPGDTEEQEGNAGGGMDVDGSEIEEDGDGEEEIQEGFPGTVVEAGEWYHNTDGLLKWELESEILLSHTSYLDRTPEAVPRLMAEYASRSIIRADLAWGDNYRYMGTEEQSYERIPRGSRREAARQEEKGWCYVLGDVIGLEAGGCCDGSYMGGLFPWDKGIRRSDIKWVNRPLHQQVQGVYPTLRNPKRDEYGDWCPSNCDVRADDIELEYCHSSVAIVFEVGTHKERCKLLDKFCEERMVEKLGKDTVEKILRDGMGVGKENRKEDLVVGLEGKRKRMRGDLGEGTNGLDKVV
ncbi:hypothetical protein BJ508DRAFT_158059 [Ascobolus immersus RN42]|uniref:Uncharacterized protein n=1 Tax=Ascobolus immersus RN42 TaxID=1160509 RepID=A0A3N4IIH9_ASCIM|nr:hypothetical protein BJ508DRAFT_158059 [Ascobolus immersus RN42]